MTERSRLSAVDVLSKPVSFPSKGGQARISALVGLDDHIEALTRDLRLIFDPQLVEGWSESHYGTRLPAIDLLKDAVPLVVFEGDVGTGKTALAEAIGQRVASEGSYGVHLVKVSTQVRGAGYVGEMGTLLAESFKQVESICAQKGEPVIFVIDEADSLLTTRTSAQQHHEDKSGVNTVLQHLDEFRKRGSQIAVIAITNRVGVLDPAVRRRATSVYSFERPNARQREELLRRLFGCALSEGDLVELVDASQPTGEDDGPVPFTYSDLTLRFVVPAVRKAAWANEPLSVKVLAASLERLVPSPCMPTEDDDQLETYR